MNVAESAKWIASEARHVFINDIDKQALELYECIKTEKYSTENWKNHELNRADLNWIFLIDLLNFSFWDGYDGQDTGLAPFAVSGYTGYWSLCAAVNRALDNGIPITSPSWMASCSFEDIQGILKPDLGSKQVPMLAERFDLIKKAGKILVDNLSFESLLSRANKSAQNLIEIVLVTFGDIFDDSLTYKTRKVCFHKRVQILVADIWASGVGAFHDIDTITMFADYRVPQSLVYFGVISYSSELLEILKRHERYHNLGGDINLLHRNLLMRGDQMEVEIRGASIHSVELLVAKIKDLIQTNGDHGLKINAVILDFYLWDLAKAKREAMSSIPIHRTRSIFY